MEPPVSGYSHVAGDRDRFIPNVPICTSPFPSFPFTERLTVFSSGNRTAIAISLFEFFHSNHANSILSTVRLTFSFITG